MTGRPMRLDYVMSHWVPGSDDWSWHEEANDLIHRDGPALLLMVRDVALNGRQMRAPLAGEDPILLGDDGRVWNGHHRIVAAWLAGARRLHADIVNEPVPVAGYSKTEGDTK